MSPRRLLVLVITEIARTPGFRRIFATPIRPYSERRDQGCGGSCRGTVEYAFHPARICIPVYADLEDASLTEDRRQIQARIGLMVEAMKDDPSMSTELFQYLWSMLCVRRGLLRVVREVASRDGFNSCSRNVTGNRRFVARPAHLEPEPGGAAVQALASMVENRPTMRSA